jgi:hypothetical protein
VVRWEEALVTAIGQALRFSRQFCSLCVVTNTWYIQAVLICGRYKYKQYYEKSGHTKRRVLLVEGRLKTEVKKVNTTDALSIQE